MRRGRPHGRLGVRQVNGSCDFHTAAPLQTVRVGCGGTILKKKNSFVDGVDRRPKEFIGIGYTLYLAGIRCDFNEIIGIVARIVKHYSLPCDGAVREACGHVEGCI